MGFQACSNDEVDNVKTTTSNDVEAVSSFAAFILGTGMKLAVSLAIGFYVIRALFV